MPGFGDTTFIVLLALLLFGPKKLPGLARQLGKLMAEFRRASNEFRTQMEEEFRISEQAERQKQVAALEAAAPSQPIPEPEHPHIPPPLNPDSAAEASAVTPTEPTIAPPEREQSTPAPLPIASAGDLDLMPPSTGLPVANTSLSRSEEPEPAPAPSTNGTHPEHAPEPRPVHG